MALDTPIERLIVRVPFDLHEGIHPWGPALVCAAVSQNCPGTAAEILDLRTLDFFQAAQQRYEREAAPQLAGLTNALRNAAHSWWDRSEFKASCVFASTLLLGEDLLDLPRRLRLRARPHLSRSLRPILRDVRQQVVDGFQARFAGE